MKNGKRFILVTFGLLITLSWGCENPMFGAGYTSGILIAHSVTLLDGVYVQVRNQNVIGTGSVETIYIPDGGTLRDFKEAKKFRNLCMVVNPEVFNLQSITYNSQTDSLSKVKLRQMPIGFNGRKVSFEYRFAKPSDKKIASHFDKLKSPEGTYVYSDRSFPYKSTEKDMTFIYVTRICSK